MENAIDAASWLVKEVGGVAKTFSKNDEVSSRHEVNMLADSRLSKNARPIALLWCWGSSLRELCCLASMSRYLRNFKRQLSGLYQSLCRSTLVEDLLKSTKEQM